MFFLESTGRMNPYPCICSFLECRSSTMFTNRVSTDSTSPLHSHEEASPSVTSRHLDWAAVKRRQPFASIAGAMRSLVTKSALLGASGAC